jgi:hypothetical protein
LRRSTSPLLALDGDILKTISSYLNEEALYKLELASPLVDKSIHRKHWEYLDQQRPFNSLVASGARTRGIRFAEASKMAQKMESSAAIHYRRRTTGSHCQPRTPYAWPEELYTMEDFRSCQPDELFVRMAYHDNDDNAVVVEGFLPRVKCLSSCSGHHTFAFSYLVDHVEALVQKMGADLNAPITRDDLGRWRSNRLC